VCGARIHQLDLAHMDENAIRALGLPRWATLAFLCQQLLPRRGADAAEAWLRRWADLLAGIEADDHNVRLLSSYVLETARLPQERLRSLFRDLIGPWPR
jgi:hypothetical protein